MNKNNSHSTQQLTSEFQLNTSWEHDIVQDIYARQQTRRPVAEQVIVRLLTAARWGKTV